MLLTTHPFTERHSPYIWIQAASRGEICLKDSPEARGGWTEDNWFIRIHKTTRTGHGWCHLIWWTRRCIWKIMHHHLLLFSNTDDDFISFPVDRGGHSSCSTNIGISPPNLRVTPYQCMRGGHCGKLIPRFRSDSDCSTSTLQSKLCLSRSVAYYGLLIFFCDLLAIENQSLHIHGYPWLSRLGMVAVRFFLTCDVQESQRIATWQDFEQEELGTWRTGNLQQRLLHCERSLGRFCLETDTLLHTGNNIDPKALRFQNLCAAILRWIMVIHDKQRHVPDPMAKPDA